MRILVVYGGFGLSQEAEISELSGKQVAEAAQAAGFDVTELRLTKDNLEELKSQLKNFDVAFPVLHGKFGEDGGIQQILEEAGVKYIGCDARSSKLCFDKNIHKEKLSQAGILTPKWQIITKEEEIDNLQAPIVVKPVQGGASIDMLLARTPEELDKEQLKTFLARHGELMAEEYIQGQEAAVGMLGEETLPVIEIVPPEGEWFDYNAKYNERAQENVPPKHISEDMQTKLQEASLRVHKLCGCRYLSRTDMLIKDGEIYVLETNTMPGMTTRSLYPKEAQAAGYDMPALVKKLIELAI